FERCLNHADTMIVCREAFIDMYFDISELRKAPSVPQQYRGDMVVDPRGATREFCGGDESHFVINYGENMLQDLFTVVYKIEFGDITETLICHRENDVINHIQ
ncbi:MAG: hypothetical protein II387_07910, partial [Oscillospiraceae bacterium]|nr:hypothetical protein [Oscillospiraceae bacterium]